MSVLSLGPGWAILLAIHMHARTHLTIFLIELDCLRSQSSMKEAVEEEELELGDVVQGEVLDALVLDEVQATSVEISEEDVVAIEAAEEFIGVYGDELLAEADVGRDALSPAAGVSARADKALDR